MLYTHGLYKYSIHPEENVIKTPLTGCHAYHFVGMNSCAL